MMFDAFWRKAFLFLKLLRVLNLLMILVGVLFSFEYFENTFQINFSIEKRLYSSFALIMVTAGGYWINNYFDQKIDIINKPNQTLIGEAFSAKIIIIVYVLLNVLGVAISLLNNWVLFAYILVVAMTLFFYSIYLKKTFLMGNIIVAILMCSSLCIPLFYCDSEVLLKIKYDYYFQLYLILAFLISLLREVIKDKEDSEGDAINGCRTLAIVCDEKIFKILSTILVLMSIAGVGCLYLKIQESTYSTLFSIVFLLLCIIGYLIVKAGKKENYSQISLILKLIMFASMFGLILM